MGEAQDITIDSNTFRVYLSGTEGPVLALLHGGGYSALTWALFTVSIVSYYSRHILYFINFTARDNESYKMQDIRARYKRTW